jgi:hypothetical protein
MSCYLRHLREVLAEAGIEVTPANRKQVDAIMHRFVGVTYKDCSATWRTLKFEVLADANKRKELVDYLRGSVPK